MNMADALVEIKCVVKGYQECSFDVEEGEIFNVFKKIGEKGRAFRVANERGRYLKVILQAVIMRLQLNFKI